MREMFTTAHTESDEQSHERSDNQSKHQHLNNVAKGQSLRRDWLIIDTRYVRRFRRVARQRFSPVGLFDIEISNIVKENGRRVTQRIDSIQHAAVTWNNAAEVFDSKVSFDRA